MIRFICIFRYIRWFDSFGYFDILHRVILLKISIYFPHESFSYVDILKPKIHLWYLIYYEHRFFFQYMKYLIITNCLFTQIYLFKTHFNHFDIFIIVIHFAIYDILSNTDSFLCDDILILSESFFCIDILRGVIHLFTLIYFSSPIHLNSMIYSLLWFAFIWWNIFDGDHSLPHHDIFILQIHLPSKICLFYKIRFYFEKYLLLQLI